MFLSRRRFAALTASWVAASTLGEACSLGGSAFADDGRLTARPRGDVKTTAQGEQHLGLGDKRDAVLRMPTKVVEPLPLLVMFHGAGGSGQGVLRRVVDAADAAGVAVLAPDSRGQTWDAIRGSFGADTPFVNRALERVFETVAIDPLRVAAGGFSDGATYALSLALINGDLFPKVVAFSPGFIVERAKTGKPKFFVSHGTQDPILPIEQCSRVIVPALRGANYDVTFKQFAGGHEVPSAIATEALQWLAAR